MKIGIVNDTYMAIEVLRRVVEQNREHQVIWVAPNGAEAVKRCAAKAPDVVLMDLIMPVMDGVEATRKIMAESPCAILLVTASVTRNTSKVFEALGAGALDVVRTPVSRGKDCEQTLLLNKLRAIEKLVQAERRGKALKHPDRTAPPEPGKTAVPNPPLVAVGASSGGPAALSILMAGLPKNFSGSVVIVQHIDQEFAPGLAQWLDSRSRLPVALARHQEPLARGTVRVSEGGHHLMLSPEKTLVYSEQPEKVFHKPSVDVFFNSVAAHWKGPAVGVVLTGMGRDGAEGLQAMAARGFTGIAQDKATSAIFGMPSAAIRAGGVTEVLPLHEIAERLVGFLDSNQKVAKT